jgi:mycothiol synthase
MMVPVIDERSLPAMYMVWPLAWLPTAAQPALPEGYSVRACLESDLSVLRILIDAEGPVSDNAWESFLDRIVPGGAFLGVHTKSGRAVATASAVHNPRATRYYFPFGGEVGYVSVDPRHRRNGLGRLVVARVVARLIEAGYHHIFVGVQGWRLPAVKCYLSLGFVPFLHDAALLPRWRRVCEQIGWAVREGEWPHTLSSVVGAQPIPQMEARSQERGVSDGASRIREGDGVGGRSALP